MPALFVNLPSFVACVLIMAGAQLIYATIGFGAGMFAVALMALVLPDLTGVVVVLLIPTFVTEVWVLARTWRRAKIRLLGWLVPGMFAGLLLGTRILVTADVDLLKRLLGLIVIGAGLYFALRDRARPSAQHRAAHEGPPSPKRPWQKGTGTSKHTTPGANNHARLGASPLLPWISFPVGVFSGLLGALFGTGGPPVIIFLRAHGLDKTTFRSTILTFFLTMSLLRAGTYATAGLITADRVIAAALLLPGSVAGIVIGMFIHNRISERRFGQAVSLLLVVLGALLAAGVGR